MHCGGCRAEHNKFSVENYVRISEDYFDEAMCQGRAILVELCWGMGEWIFVKYFYSVQNLEKEFFLFENNFLENKKEKKLSTLFCKKVLQLFLICEIIYVLV